MDKEIIKQTFNSTNKLYHYTSFKSALKILESNTLLFGFLKNMNDIRELHRNIEIDTPEQVILTPCQSKKYLKAAETDYKKYQQLSLAMDRKRGKMGFDISAMWAHYAEYGKGICMVFNKEILLNQVNTIDFNSETLFNTVSYRKNYSNHIFYSLIDDRVELKKKSEKTVFFHKTNDWSYEQEFRIIVKHDTSERAALNFGDSLLAIIMHRPKRLRYDKPIWQSMEYAKLQSLTNGSIPILEYSFWFGNSSLALDGTTIWTSDTFNYDNATIDHSHDLY